MQENVVIRDESAVGEDIGQRGYKTNNSLIESVGCGRGKKGKA